MARRPKKSEEGGGTPGWVVTFSDLMSLLLTFFVLLLSFSTISEKDFERAIMSLQGALGVLPANLSIVNPFPRRPQEQSTRAEELARKLRRKLQVTGNESSVNVEFDATGGLKITLPEAVLFDAGSAELRAAAAPLLEDVGSVLASIPRTFVEVRGHTDDMQLGSTSRYRDNFELSFWRANSVTRRLIDAGQLDPQQFEVVAVGSGQPVAPNTTDAGRRANRRVDVYIRGVLDSDRIREIEERFGDDSVAPSRLLQQPVDFQDL
jgi:chemotaxis protein MotB